ncbi:uncharacterized protein [Temnothorax nylanderi]|uniref:uncharacterized protein n=1 Tax=Temnothorax nylanderi TaxID=102681 RepID=UPI003A842DD5
MWKRRWLFNATDFQSLMYPCFIFCRILGTFPYKINTSTFKASKPRYILSTVIIGVYCVFNLKYIFDMVIYKVIDFRDVTRNFKFSTFYTFSGFIVIITHGLNGQRMRFLQTIIKISSRLSPESYKMLSRLIHTKDIFGSFFLIGLVFMYYYMKYIDIIFMIYFLYTLLHSFTMDMLYINCVCILKACFKEINNNLLHMQELIVNKKPYVPIMFYYEQRNAFLIMNLKALKKQHLMVSNAVQMLNKIFSLQLLAMIVITFSEIIFGPYFHVVRYNKYNGLFIYLDEVIGLAFLRTTYQIIKVALLAWACETGKNQAQEIRTTIHDVLNISRDEQIKNELQLFSLQTLHCENTFSAKGLNVDATFLATMTGTITTYMLILLQFLIISHSCDEKPAINGT